MSFATAELIVKVLEASENRYSQYRDDPVVAKYVKMRKDKYGELRTKTDFQNASRIALAETIGELLIDKRQS